MQKRIIIFTGDGKGKTTAAAGVAARAAGNRLNVVIIQFIKNQPSGEECLEGIRGIRMERYGGGFVFPNATMTEHHRRSQEAMESAGEALESTEYDVVILDEVLCAIPLGLVKEGELVKMLQGANNKIIVLTGRNATQTLIDLADTVSEIKCIKHAFQIGVKGQPGVEF